MRALTNFLSTCICFALAALLIPGCSTSSSVQQRAPVPLRVMTFNIHHGEGLDGKLDLERIARVITDSKADLVALQEVDRGLPRTARRDLPAELQSLTGLTAVFSNNYAFDGGQYGNAILSRFPIISTTNHPLPTITATETRGLLETVLQLPSGRIRFMATHLDHRRPDEDRLAAVDKIFSILQGGPAIPAIIAGDFNCTPESEPYRRLTAVLQDAWPRASREPGHTIPVRDPTRRIDYIFVTPSSPWNPSSGAVISSEASDHLPVIVELIPATQ